MARSVLTVPGVLEYMLSERRAGASLLWLGRKYHVDHTTILWHCRKHNVQPPEPLIGGRRKAPHIAMPASVIEELESIDQALLPLDYEDLPQAKSYKDYLRDAMVQKEMKHYFGQIYKMDPLHPQYTRDFRKMREYA